MIPFPNTQKRGKINRSILCPRIAERCDSDVCTLQMVVCHVRGSQYTKSGAEDSRQAHASHATVTTGEEPQELDR